VINQGGSGGGVDLVEVARDAGLLDQLAARAAILDGDAVSAMLAAFAAEVDDGLVALLDDVEPADRRPAARPADRVLAAVPDVPAAPRGGHGLRAATIAVVLGATLSVSGVAAAVTGDPLSPYKGIVSAVNGGNHHELPPHAARVAKMNHTLVGTRAQIAHGDLAGAHATLAALRLNLASMTDLTTGQRHAIEARIAALEAALGRATSQAAGHEKQQKSGTKGSHNAVPNDTKTSEPNNTKTPEPNNTKTPEPNNTKSPEPANTEAPASGGTHTAEPQNTKTAKPTDSAVGGGGGSGAGDGGAAQSAATATDAASTGGGSGGGGGTAHGKGATH
jgi:hypothetical protein